MPAGFAPLTASSPMRRARRMSGSPGRMRSPVTRWPTAPARRLSIAVRRTQPACPGRRAEEGGLPMSDELNRARIIEALVALTLSLSTPVFAAESIKINDLLAAAAIPDAQRDATMKALRASYDFWNTGHQTLLQEPTPPTFVHNRRP